jgi:hypothetical protein
MMTQGDNYQRHPQMGRLARTQKHHAPFICRDKKNRSTIVIPVIVSRQKKQVKPTTNQS